MNTRLLSIPGAAILALAAAPALAQPIPAAASSRVSPASPAGHWLHDGRGRIVGSVRSISPDGRTATVVLGVYTLDNLRVIDVPAGALSVVDGKVTLRRETAEALNTVPSR